jgi:NAD+--asparagine ADP-ribosyltransferase
MNKLEEYLISGDINKFTETLENIDYLDGSNPGFILDIIIDGGKDFLKTAIESHKIDLLYNNGLALEITTEINNIEMTKMLLDTGLFDISMKDNIIFKNAIENENEDMTKMIIDYGIVPEYDDMEMTIIYDTVDIAKYIANTGVFIDNNLLSLAISYNNYDMVKYILSFDQIDPTANDYLLFRQALDSNNEEIINIMETDKRNDPNKIKEILIEEEKYGDSI